MKKNHKDAFRTISLSREMDNVIQRIASERDCSVSSLIRHAVRVTFAKEIAAWREILAERQRGAGAEGTVTVGSRAKVLTGKVTRIY